MLSVILIASVLIIYIGISYSVTALPTGSLISTNRSERAIAASPDTVAAQAGNVTEIDIIGSSLTRSWQGYFGNVSGTITLDDANNNTLYNWSLASPEGEVYAANNTVTWSNVQCFNFTATGLNANESYNYTSDVEQRGATNLYGKNLTELENEFNITWDDVDGVDETFSLTQGIDQHDLFYTGDLQFSGGECLFTRLFGDTGNQSYNEFEEILLWDPDGNNTIFASILEEEETIGFDDTPKDFEMIVLENGHGTDIATTNYYFYIELE